MNPVIESLADQLKVVKDFNRCVVVKDLLETLDNEQNESLRHIIDTTPCDIKTILLREQLIGESRVRRDIITAVRGLEYDLEQQLIKANEN